MESLERHDNDGQEQYSCDRCHSRKLKCSREPRRCQQCKAANSECQYSRHGALPRRVKRRLTKDNTGSTHSSIEDRLSRIESSISALTSAVQDIAASVGGKSFDNDSNDNYSLNGQDRESSGAKESSHAPLGLSLGPQTHDEPDRPKHMHVAETSSREAAELASTFGSLAYNDDVPKQLRKLRRANEPFFIPDSSVGDEYKAIFLEYIDRMSPMLIRPEPAEAERIIYQPVSSEDRGWVLLFNCVLSTHYSICDGHDSTLARQFRWNTWLALDEGGIFIEPSLVAVQAFLVLSNHGYEYSTPILSWTFINHACRLMLAIGLPDLKNSRNESEDMWAHRVSLFWCIYTSDRSLALSFNRPAALPESMCEQVPPPSLSTVAKFNPHSKIPAIRETGLILTTFGGRFFIQYVKLFKLVGKIVDFAFSNEPSIKRWRVTKSWKTDEASEIRSQMRAWFEETSKELPEPSEDRPEHEKREERMGISNLRFQYYHILVTVTRDNKKLRAECIDAAQNALLQLPHLVSHAMSHYNGIVWLLLFYPFTSFFIIFGETIANPESPAAFKYLNLLRSTVFFLLQMTKNHQSASKLANIADTFAKLAEDHVRRALQTSEQGPIRTTDNDYTRGQKRKSEAHTPHGDPEDHVLDSRPAFLSLSSPNELKAPSSVAAVAPWQDTQPTFSAHQPPEQHDFSFQGSDPPQALVDYFTSINTPHPGSASSSSHTQNTTPDNNPHYKGETPFTTQQGRHASNPDIPSLGPTTTPSSNTFAMAPTSGAAQGDAARGLGVDDANMGAGLDIDSIMQNLGQRAAEKPLDVGFDFLDWDGVGLGRWNW